MKYGFRTGGFSGWKVEDVVKDLANLGFDGAELCLEPADMRPENFTQDRAKEIRKLMDKIGLEITSVSYHADFENSEQRRENTFKAVDITKWLGADTLIINSERVEDQKKQWSELAKMLKQLTEKAEGTGVYIAIEPEPLQIIPDTEAMLKMINEVGSPNLKVNLDVGHAYITDPDLIESIKKLGSVIIHAHIEDIKDKVHNHLELGQGDIDLRAMDIAFKEVGYKGYYVVDLFRLGDDPVGVASRTIKALRETFS
jgi:sugar phosphate isomerase/epimerase